MAAVSDFERERRGRFSRIDYNVSLLPSGLRRAEMRRGGLPPGHELPRPRAVGVSDEEEPTTATGRSQHVHRVEAEGNDTFDGGETRHLHGQLDHDARVAGECLLTSSFDTMCPFCDTLARPNGHLLGCLNSSIRACLVWRN